MDKRIGASEVPALFTDDGFARLYAVKAGLIERDDSDNEAMLLGRELESGVLRCSGLEVVEVQPEYRTGPPLFLVTHPDAVCKDGWIVEVKTTGLTGKTDWPDDGIPDRVLYQVQAQLMASRAPGCMVVALVAGKGLCKHLVQPDALLQGVIERRILRLWDCVDGRAEPPRIPESSAGDLPPTPPSPKKRIVLDDSEAALAAQRFLECKEQIKRLSDEADALRSKIEAAMGDAEEAFCGPYKIKRTAVRQIRLDTKLVKAMPSCYKESVYFRFDVSVL